MNAPRCDAQPAEAAPKRREMPLSSASPGQELILLRMEGGRGFLHRMAELGLTPGVRFRVIRSSRLGPFIISVKDTRMMIGHGMTSKVTVRPA